MKLQAKKIKIFSGKEKPALLRACVVLFRPPNRLAILALPPARRHVGCAVIFFVALVFDALFALTGYKVDFVAR